MKQRPPIFILICLYLFGIQTAKASPDNLAKLMLLETPRTRDELTEIAKFADQVGGLLSKKILTDEMAKILLTPDFLVSVVDLSAKEPIKDGHHLIMARSSLAYMLYKMIGKLQLSSAERSLAFQSLAANLRNILKQIKALEKQGVLVTDAGFDNGGIGGLSPEETASIRLKMRLGSELVSNLSAKRRLFGDLWDALEMDLPLPDHRKAYFRLMGISSEDLAELMKQTVSGQ